MIYFAPDNDPSTIRPAQKHVYITLRTSSYGLYEVSELEVLFV